VVTVYACKQVVCLCTRSRSLHMLGSGSGQLESLQVTMEVEPWESASKGAYRVEFVPPVKIFYGAV
jgi:hypothetical protein